MPSAHYDSVVYDASAHTHTHPTRLATMAYLLGLEPPRLYNARSLEFGCTTGTTELVEHVLRDVRNAGLLRA